MPLTAPKQQPRSFFETTINLKQNNPIIEVQIILKSAPPFADVGTLKEREFPAKDPQPVVPAVPSKYIGSVLDVETVVCPKQIFNSIQKTFTAKILFILI